MSWLPVAEMLIGLGTFGFLYWITNGIVEYLMFVSLTGTTYDIVVTGWNTLPFIVLFFAGIYLLMQMQKRRYSVGGF